MATADPDRSSRSSLRELTFYSLLTGLTPLIPLPFADDWTLGLVRKRLASELGRRHGAKLDSRAIEVLALGEKSWEAEGCLRSVTTGCAFGLVLYLVKKLFRKIILFLLVKDCIDAFSRTFHEGFLLDHALGLGALTQAANTTGAPPPARLRAAIEAVCREVDPRPVERLVRKSLKGSWQLLRQAAKQLARIALPLRRRARAGEEGLWEEVELEAEEPLLGGLTDRLSDALGEESGYLEDLRRRLEAKLEADSVDS